MTKKELKNLRAFCNSNKEQIEKSEKCGCFYCLEIFDSKEVTEYIAYNTALCPKCNIDSVLPDSAVPLSQEMLTEMRMYWFESKKNKKINSKKKNNEKITYISSLSKQEIKQSLQSKISSFYSMYNVDFMYDKAEENTISFGIERGGHSGGYFYVATLEDCPDGCRIEGEIKFLPEKEHKSTESKFGEIIAYIIFFIPIIIILLVLSIIAGVIQLVEKIKSLFKKDTPLYKISRSKEKKLDIFMTEFLSAKKIKQ